MIFRREPPTEPGSRWFQRKGTAPEIVTLYEYDGALYTLPPPGHAKYGCDIHEFLESLARKMDGLWGDRIAVPTVEEEG